MRAVPMPHAPARSLPRRSARRPSRTVVTLAVSALVATLGLAAVPAATAAPAAPPVSGLTAGQQLGPGQALTSPAGGFRLVAQTDGNLVQYTDRGVPVWSSGTSGRGPSTLVAQGDGNLVLYTAAGVPTWYTGTRELRSLAVQDDGNIVVYGASAARWCTCALPFGRISGSPSSMPTGWGMLAGDTLRGGDRTLTLQPDGNLVLYGPSAPLWWTGTGGGATNRAVFQTDGNLVVYRSDGVPLWNSGTANLAARTLLVDANFGLRLATAADRTVWTVGAAAPTGLAGDVFAELNRERAANGLSTLTSDPRLVAAAAAHNNAMIAANSLAHQVPGEPEASARITAAGYSWRLWAELVGVSRTATTAGVVALQRSKYETTTPDDSERRIILWSEVSQVGVAVQVDPRGRAWITWDFGLPY